MIQTGQHQTRQADKNLKSSLEKHIFHLLQENIIYNSMKQTSKIGSFLEVSECKDPEGLRVFYYLV